MTQPRRGTASSALALVVDLVRTGRGSTAAELVRSSGFTRRRVDALVDEALQLGLLDGDPEGVDWGHARARVTFPHRRGRFAIAAFGPLELELAVTDLRGSVLAGRSERWDPQAGPMASLGHAFSHLDALIAADPAPMWGSAVGLPPSAGWTTSDAVAAAGRYGAPAWTETTLGLEARGELARRPGLGGDILYVTVGTGLGAMLAGCADRAAVVLRPIASPPAASDGVVRRAEAAAREGRSFFLRARLAEAWALDPADVADGAERGDPECRDLLVRAAADAGGAIAGMVSAQRPALVVVGGGAARSPAFLAALRATVYARALPAATRDLEIVPAAPSSAVIGAARTLTSRVFGCEMAAWVRMGRPLPLVGEPSVGEAAEAGRALA
ncbi:putative NBD/HSP70 family sugar kinase [Sinomonas atrocyanea]|uniref:ROK family protein n=1 Tax=Sinomonas atrocyanea TaxID=37927 RepID=UPI00277E3013|nr:ROK family protein [Sinomonas atrocyanea]MDP9884536.1 putative NBD/HSP70 family sugar kinase [Sinomonas atrocyanea]